MPETPGSVVKRFITPLLLIAALLLIRIEYGMLLFHTLAELFSIVVGVLMLVIAWNTRRFTHNDFLLYLGIGYFWIAVLDTWHTLTVVGLPFFHFPDAEVTLHFWLYARFLEALLLLTAPLMLRHKLNVSAMWLGSAGLVALVIWLSLSVAQPVLLTAQGLTPFKVGAEYFIMAMLLLAFFIYRRNRPLLSAEVLDYMLISLVLTFMAEYSFTLYRNFYGIPFVVGHLFKFLSFWMIYQAIVRTTLARPFAMLASHSSSYNAIPHAAVVVDDQGIIRQVNRAAERFADKPAAQLLHTHVHAEFHCREQTVAQCEVCQAIQAGVELQGLELSLKQKNQWFLVSLSPIELAGKSRGTVQLLTEVSARKRIEQALQNSERRFRHLFEQTDAISVQGYDRHRRVIYWNPASERLYGYSRQQALGKKLEDLIIPAPMREPVIAGVDQWVNGGVEIPSSELSLQRADGSTVHVYSSHVMIRNSENEPEMYCIDIDLSESRAARLALEKQEQWLRQVLRTLPYGVQENDAAGKITYANEALHRIHRLADGELIGRNIWDFEVGAEKKAALRDYLKYLVEQQPPPQPYITQNWVKDGDQPKTVEVIWDYQRNDEGQVTGFVSVISDISERRAAEDALRQSEERFQDFAETAADMFWEMDENLRFSYISGKVEMLMDRPTASVIGKTREQLYSDQSFVNKPWFQLHLQTLKQHRSFVNLEIPYESSSGISYLQLSGKPRYDESGRFLGYRGTTRNITENKLTEKKVLHQAHYDSLTDLPNRFLALDRLRQVLKEAQRHQKKVAVIFLDLDDFKKVNDSLGHEIGDKLLIEAAQRLKNVVRAGDTVGRLGGDEFIVLLGDLDSAADALPITENLLNRLRDSFHIEGRELILSGSVGIAIYPQDGDTSSELLRNADSAMYHAKEKGRNTYSFFTEEMNQQVSRRLEIEEQIHGALGRGEFCVYFQPKINVGDGRLAGAEALLRWNNPALGAISPLEFIPIAEQTGLIIPIGEFVLQQSLDWATQWHAQGQQDFRIAVNLSPRQFRDPELVRNVASAVARSGLPAAALELEITEGVLLSGHAHIQDALAGLKALGVSLAMDDFGTGYSSLSYLRNYPFDVLKIDQSFVRDITEDPADRELINAAIAMAHSLHLKVVAEGVETRQQLEYLQQIDCDYLQGYLFGKPMTAQAFEQKFGGSGIDQVS